MSINTERITLRHFDPNSKKCPTDENDSFKILALFTDGKNTTLEDIRILEVNDKKSARLAYVKLFNNAGTGQPFKAIFDGQQYHKGHEFEYQGHTRTIWRLWLAGTIRIYFIFLPPKNILILKTLAKRKDDLNKADKKQLEDMVKKIIDCQKNNNVIEDKS